MSSSQYQQYGGNPYAPAADGREYSSLHPYGITPIQSLQAPPPSINRTSGFSQASHYSTPATQTHTNTSNYAVYSLQDFLTSVDSIRQNMNQLASNVTQIGALHQRGLTDPDISSTSALESTVTQTQILNTQIRDRIKSLELDAAKTQSESHDKKTKQGQVKTLKAGFERELESY
ncbi:MAG: hypothetical protein M1830_010272, partial [Pleopsidium flavum]